MGRLHAIVLFGLAGAGCAQLFGIEQTSGGGGDAPATPRVSLSFVRLSIGATSVRAPQDLTGYSATYEIPDPTDPSGLRAVPALQSASDTWSADIADGTPPVQFTLPDFPAPLTRMWALPARTVKGLYGWLEHPNPEPAPAGAMFTVQVALPTPYAANESLQLYTVGSWTALAFSGPQLPAVGAGQLGPFSFSFASATSITGRPLEKITRDDAVHVLRYVGNDLTGVFDAPSFDQTGSDMIAGTMAPVAHDQTLDVMLQLPGGRYANTRPASPSTNLGMAWYLHAAPGYLVANDNGPLLQAVGVAPADTGHVTATYGNPFLSHDWRTVLTWSTNQARAYTPPGMLPMTLYAGMFSVSEPAAGANVALAAGLPISISVDQVPLLTDGMTVKIDPAKSVDLSYVVDQPANTLYQMTLYELVPNAAGTALTYAARMSVTGAEPHFIVPPDKFEVGHIYTLRAIVSRGGYPTLAAGDLTNRELPVAVSYLDSGVFTVVAP